jgi:ATP-dependent Clp protease ATP-binding subunit ClpA
VPRPLRVPRSVSLNQDHSTDAMEVIKKSFTPEFRNRLDTIIQFGRLSTRSS